MFTYMMDVLSMPAWRLTINNKRSESLAVVTAGCCANAWLTSKSTGIFKAATSNGDVVLTSLAHDCGLQFVDVDFIPCRKPEPREFYSV